jgi:DNA-binding transcriptional LysR family regulator
MIAEQQMKIHQVSYFLALCEQQSFTRAARCCGVAQPSLTRAIQQLEHELGGRLFERGKSNIRLTALGSFLRPDFLRIYQATADVMRKVEKFSAARSDPHALQQTIDTGSRPQQDTGDPI